ncbi:hypothetical protein [Jiulongibacter sp. NS-SX5]|uniref:hypothetical protein n=1 Tax=Jiulongibacter sp. NS-SX5 TaxID=3463854 RepID=UPI004057F83A
MKTNITNTTLILLAKVFFNRSNFNFLEIPQPEIETMPVRKRKEEPAIETIEEFQFEGKLAFG